MKRCILFTSLIIFSFLLTPLVAQEPYKLPPKEVVEIVDAPPTPMAEVSPKGDLMLLVEYNYMPSIKHMAQPMLRLAGLRITPKTNIRQTTVFYTGLVLLQLDSGQTRRIPLPEGGEFGFPEWSHDGKWLAFIRYLDDGVELWVVDVAKGEAKAVTPPMVNAVGDGFLWMPDNRHLLVSMIPEGRGPAPDAPAVPVGPIVQETAGKFAPVRTYQDLLTSPYDEELFDYYATAQLMVLDVETGSSRPLGSLGVYIDISPSPNGEFLLVEKVEHPDSYSVPVYRFAHSIEVWNMKGKMVHLVADLPVADEVPIGGVVTGPRSVYWRPLQPATLVWAEALDEGNPKKDVPHRDRLMMVSAPFEDEPKEVFKVQQRYAGTRWLATEGEALVIEYEWTRRWRTTRLVNFDDPSVEPKVVFDLSSQDRYGDPGSPISRTTPAGERILLQDGDWLYLSGRGSSPEGDRPFLDRMNIRTLKKERIFQCGPTSYETFITFVGDDWGRVVTRYESKTEPPNYFRRNLKSDQRVALTDFKDPAPQLTGMKKQLVKYQRDDGVPLSGTLYLPPDYKEGERLPLVVWAYPLEYSDVKTAGQVRGSPNRFTFFRGYSQLFFVTQGYAVLDGAQMPVIGDPETMNETFVQQIVANAKAAIDKLDSMGIIDPQRVGVGGHSYGAFMTANLLAHCDLFAAGIARSGAYNRTLTPFGFQSERRTLWQAPDLYFKVSPFMHAHKINEPILLIHGEVDNNSGTFPIQSKRLYHAIKGHGATARFVLLPHESHGYRARESVLHVLAEMFEWFDKYVKKK
ncbi:prolyl oligopeptidase [bacterium (candidate division B38) B3_B38]|nr:MAG: prolyl oligopeptidase [bacterium (candidate division B38) B3_B38]